VPLNPDKRYFWLADGYFAAAARSWRANPVLPITEGLVATCPGVGVYKSRAGLYTIPDLGLDKEQILDVIEWCIQNVSTTFHVPAASYKEDLVEPPAYLPKPPYGLPERVYRLADDADDPESLYGRVFSILVERYKEQPFGFAWQAGTWEAGNGYIVFFSRHSDLWFYPDGNYDVYYRTDSGDAYRFCPRRDPAELIVSLYKSLVRGELLKEAAELLIEAVTG